jgi:hypothetical protein
LHPRSQSSFSIPTRYFQPLRRVCHESSKHCEHSPHPLLPR